MGCTHSGSQPRRCLNIGCAVTLGYRESRCNARRRGLNVSMATESIHTGRAVEQITMKVLPRLFSKVAISIQVFNDS